MGWSLRWIALSAILLCAATLFQISIIDRLNGNGEDPSMAGMVSALSRATPSGSSDDEADTFLDDLSEGGDKPMVEAASTAEAATVTWFAGEQRPLAASQDWLDAATESVGEPDGTLDFSILTENFTGSFDVASLAIPMGSLSQYGSPLGTAAAAGWTAGGSSMRGGTFTGPAWAPVKAVSILPLTAADVGDPPAVPAPDAIHGGLVLLGGLLLKSWRAWVR